MGAHMKGKSEYTKFIELAKIVATAPKSKPTKKKRRNKPRRKRK